MLLVTKVGAAGAVGGVLAFPDAEEVKRHQSAAKLDAAAGLDTAVVTDGKGVALTIFLFPTGLG